MASPPSHHATRRGPRGDSAAVKDSILDAARTVFSESGYQAATVKAIATRAGVDTKLVHYYYGTKAELFGVLAKEALQTIGLFEQLHAALGHKEKVGESYIRSALTAIESPETGTIFLGLLRSIGPHEESRRVFLDMLEKNMLTPLSAVQDAPLDFLRLNLVGTQLHGLIVSRYIIKFGPLATLSIDEVARLVGPTIDAYLTGDLNLPVEKEGQLLK